MTNREYLNTLDNEDFLDLIVEKRCEFYEKHYKDEDTNDINSVCESVKRQRKDFINWLNEEHEINL